jgi:hypothetical protein
MSRDDLLFRLSLIWLAAVAVAVVFVLFALGAAAQSGEAHKDGPVCDLVTRDLQEAFQKY